MIINLRRKKLYIFLVLILMLIFIFSTEFFWRIFYPIPYRDLIRQYAAANNLDPFLVTAVIRTESKFNPKVRSKSGAMGLMQIMPETGSWIADQMELESFSESELYEEEMNIRLGTWYLANLIKQFKSETIAISAYNAGRGNVKRWLDEGTWDGTEEQLDAIPFGETKDYVKKVLNYRQTYKDIYDDKF